MTDSLVLEFLREAVWSSLKPWLAVAAFLAALAGFVYFVTRPLVSKALLYLLLGGGSLYITFDALRGAARHLSESWATAKERVENGGARE